MRRRRKEIGSKRYRERVSNVKKNIKKNIKIKKFIKSGGREVTREGERIEMRESGNGRAG